MAGATTILAQSTPSLLVGFPTWRTPVLLRAVFLTVAGGAQTMVAAETTPGLTVAETADGVYTLTFPACRRVGRFVGAVSPLTPATGTNHRVITFEAANAAEAASGTIVCRSIEVAGSGISRAAAGGTVEITFWADLS